MQQSTIDAYYATPNICNNCKHIIDLRHNRHAYEIRRLKFCTRACSASFFNTLTPKRGRRSRPCIRGCGNLVRLHQKRCMECRNKESRATSSAAIKAELSHQCIRSNARVVTEKRAQECFICSYSICVETAHIKPVKAFSPHSTMGEINHPDNLVLLCPNHHFEFDAGYYCLVLPIADKTKI